MCDGVPLPAIADAEGTPLYVYSAARFAARYRAIDAAFDGYPHALHYALKANSTLAVARLLRQTWQRRRRELGLGNRCGAQSRFRAAGHRLHRRRQVPGGDRMRGRRSG